MQRKLSLNSTIRTSNKNQVSLVRVHSESGADAFNVIGCRLRWCGVSWRKQHPAVSYVSPLPHSLLHSKIKSFPSFHLMNFYYGWVDLCLLWLMFLVFAAAANGTVIQLQSMGHGSQSGMDCSDRTTPRQLQEDQCLHAQMQGWAKLMWETTLLFPTLGLGPKYVQIISGVKKLN